jgi:nucleoside-diphosphate-sugar epimerase
VRVLVAGATGAVGRPLTRQLLETGHEVWAMTRSPGRRGEIEGLGARLVVADALDERAVRGAVEEARPEVIVHQLTALPRAGPTRMRDMRATNELRTVGTDNLIAAARTAGVRRIVAQSIVFVYGYRDHGLEPITEDAPPEPGGRFAEGLEPLLYMEGRLFGTEGIEGIALRYGVFYAAHSDTVQYMRRMVRRRMMALPAGGHGICPFIHLEDAASATVRALEAGRPGEAYNVVDDEPVEWAGFIGELARQEGARPPRSVPLWLARVALPYAAYFMARVRIVASNRKAKEELVWAPRYPSFRDGLRIASRSRPAERQRRGRRFTGRAARQRP